MEFKIIKGIVTDNTKIKTGDNCNLLPSFMNVYKPEVYPNFSKEQFIDLINKQIDIRVKEKAKLDDERKSMITNKDWYSYFKFEWYEDNKMYELFLPDNHLNIIRYIFKNDKVIINSDKLEKVLDTFRFSNGDNEHYSETQIKELYRELSKNKTILDVNSMYYDNNPTTNKFSNWWTLLENLYDNTQEEYYQLPDWCLEKPIYLHNKKPLIKKYSNY